VAITQPKNRTGAPGKPGLNGAPGSVWHSVEGKPDKKLGIDGDWALDIESADVYQKISDKWILELNIKGPKGNPGKPGEDGEDGVDGKTIIRTGHLMASSGGGSGGGSGGTSDDYHSGYSVIEVDIVVQSKKQMINFTELLLDSNLTLFGS